MNGGLQKILSVHTYVLKRFILVVSTVYTYQKDLISNELLKKNKMMDAMDTDGLMTFQNFKSIGPPNRLFSIATKRWR